MCNHSLSIAQPITMSLFFTSFVIGFGSNYPVRPHHRSSSCPAAPAKCDWSTYSSQGPNANLLKGALVGGPRAPDDQFVDDRQNFVTNEVAIDYNAAFQSLLAGLRAKKCWFRNIKFQPELSFLFYLFFITSIFKRRVTLNRAYSRE